LRRLTTEVLGHHPISLVYRPETLLQPVRDVIAFVVDAMRRNSAAIRGRPTS
jgi:hypothetical protein